MKYNEKNMLRNILRDNVLYRTICGSNNDKLSMLRNAIWNNRKSLMVLGATYFILVSFFGIERTLASDNITYSAGVSNALNTYPWINIAGRFIPSTNMSVCDIGFALAQSSTNANYTISIRRDRGSNQPVGGTQPSEVLWYKTKTATDLPFVADITQFSNKTTVSPCQLLYQSSTYWININKATTTGANVQPIFQMGRTTGSSTQNTFYTCNDASICVPISYQFAFSLYGATGTISENLDYLFGTSTVPGPTVSTSSMRIGFEHYFPECYTAASSTNWWSAITGADYKCVMKEIIYSGAVSLFVPGQQSAYGVNGLEFFNENVNAFTQVFPFNIFFNFSETIRTVAEVQETTAIETNLILPWGTSIPMINSSTISRIIGNTNYDTYQTLQDSIVWIATGMLIFSSL